MGRPRKTIAELQLSGAARRNPGRIRARLQEYAEMEFRPLGPAPKFLTPEESAVWQELAALAPVTADHVHIVELAASLLAKRRGTGLGRGELPNLLACLRALCLTPADRAKVVKPVKVKKPENPFARIAAEVKRGSLLN